MADVELRGVREMVARLNAKPQQVRAACGQGLFQFGSRIMNESKERYVPVRTGALKASGQVHPAESKGNTVSVELSYGGDASAYALAVHEHPSVHSPRSWKAKGHGIQWSIPGRGPKFLEIPLKQHGTKAAMMIYLEPPIRRALEHA